jgi:hypothetical protein
MSKINIHKYISIGFSLLFFSLIFHLLSSKGIFTVYAEGPYAARTDGTATSYLYNNFVTPSISGDASVDFWFYWENDGNFVSRKSFFTTGGPEIDVPSYLFFVDPDGHLAMYDNAGHGCGENLARRWTKNTWYHIYWGRNASTGTCYFSVNGIVTTSHSAPGFFGGASSGIWFGTGIYGKINGIFDEIRLSDTVRWTGNFTLPTAEHATDIYTQALWHLNEGLGAAGEDSTGNGYMLTLSSASWVTGYFNGTPIPPPIPIPTPIPGLFGAATDGSALSYLFNTGIVPSISGDSSIDFWFYWMNDGNFGSNKSFLTTGGPEIDVPSYLFYVDPDGHLAMYDNAGHGCTESVSRSWLKDTWYHIYWGRNASNGTCYFGVNGTVSTSSSTPGNYGGATKGIWLGTGIYGKINGVFDEVRISDTVRWMDSFNVPIGEYSSDAHTLSLWHLDEGIGPVGYDSSGNGFTLALSDAFWTPGRFGPIPPNVAPVVHLENSYFTDEGSEFTSTGSFTDLDSTLWTATVDYGDGSGIQPLALAANDFFLSHIYVDDGTYTISVMVTDNQGLTGLANAVVEVLNAPFTVNNIVSETSPIQVMSVVNASATFLDPGLLDTHTAVWDWGDGVSTAGIVNDGEGTVFGSHAYSTSGIFTINLTVTDDDGVSVSAHPYEYITVYNPTPMGLFSAARIFTSPIGALGASPETTGKVLFGITSKYSGAVPTGNVSFTYKNGNLDFVSTNISLLVISGNFATLQATGTLNGVSDYNLLAIGSDGHEINTSDYVRIQIKDGNGVVIYDTQPGAPNTASPTTQVTGQVIVH